MNSLTPLPLQIFPPTVAHSCGTSLHSWSSHIWKIKSNAFSLLSKYMILIKQDILLVYNTSNSGGVE